MDLYMQQPLGFEDGLGRVCKLKKPIYGLCQAARFFYQRLDATLGEIGYKRFSADWAIWTHDGGGILGCHVDDVTAIGTRELYKDAYKMYLGFKTVVQYGSKQRLVQGVGAVVRT